MAGPFIQIMSSTYAEPTELCGAGVQSQVTGEI